MAASLPHITFFEHQSRLYSELGWTADHTAISHIERLNADAGDDLLLVGRHGLRARQHVGVLRVGGLTLQVLPKIDWEAGSNVDAPIDSPDHRTAVRSATQNLLHLLSYTHDLEIREQDVAPLLAQRADWFELLTRLFAINLHRLVQQGLDLPASVFGAR